MNVQILAVMAGISWGIWPLLASQSGLSGNARALVLTAIALVFTVPFAMKDGFGNLQVGRTSLVIAGILMATGMLLFNRMLAKADKNQVASLFIIMLMAQIAVPALFQVFSGNMTSKQIIGIIAAIIAGILLG